MEMPYVLNNAHRLVLISSIRQPLPVTRFQLPDIRHPTSSKPSLITKSIEDLCVLVSMGTVYHLHTEAVWRRIERLPTLIISMQFSATIILHLFNLVTI